MKLRSIVKHKKADMPFWLVMLIVALIFGTVIIIFISGGMDKLKKSFTSIQMKADAQTACLPASDGEDPDKDGWKSPGQYIDSSGLKVDCDKSPADPKLH